MFRWKHEMSRSAIRTAKLFFAPIYGTYLVFKEVNAELDAIAAEEKSSAAREGPSNERLR